MKGESHLPEDNLRPIRKPATYVLVELHPDGWVQVYGNEEVRVKFIHRPIFTGPREQLPEATKLIDEALALSLPKPYRDIYWPVESCGGDKYRMLTVRQWAEREASRDFELAVIRALKEREMKDSPTFSQVVRALMVVDGLTEGLARRKVPTMGPELRKLLWQKFKATIQASGEKAQVDAPPDTQKTSP